MTALPAYKKKKRDEDDAFFNPDKQSTALAATLAAARASLKNPTRPYTPGEVDRHLFYGPDNYGSRPSTTVDTLVSGHSGSSPMLASVSSSALGPETTPPPSAASPTRHKSANADSPHSVPQKHKSAGSSPAKPSVSPPAASADQSPKNDKEATLWMELKTLFRAILDPGTTPEALADLLKKVIVLVDEDTREFDIRQAADPKHFQNLVALLEKVFSQQKVISNADAAIRFCKLTLILVPGTSAKSSPQFLPSVSKLLYSLSKEKDNDAKFRTEKLLDSMLSSLSRPENMEFQPVLYIFGALKHVSDSDSSRQYLQSRQAIHTCSTFLTPAALERFKSSDKIPQMLVQVTGLLRNLASAGGKKQFIESGALKSICLLLDSFKSHAELSLNITRVLSKMTMFPECLQIVKETPGTTGALLKLLWEHPLNSPLVERACFILGNLTAEFEDCRVVVATQENAVEPLINLLCKYSQMDSEGPANSSQKESVGSPEQVLVKLIRLLANLAISRDVGPQVAAADGSEILWKMLKTKSADTHEELVLNIVGAITNYSFYYEEGDANLVLRNQLEIAQDLIPLLQSDNDEAVVESIRAFGNFSRNDEVKAMMNDKGVDEAIAALLDHRCKEVVYNACGVIMNLTTSKGKHKPRRDLLVQCIPRLLKIIANNSPSTDADLLNVSMKTLFNMCVEDSVASGAPLSMFQPAQVSEMRRATDRVLLLTNKVPKPSDDEEAEILGELVQVASQLLQTCVKHQ